MTRARVLFLALLLSLSACAPVILGRTPTPAPLGQTETSFALGYPFSLTPITVCSEPWEQPGCPIEAVIGPAYLPIIVSAHLFIARGLEDGGEFNYTFLLAVTPGVRLGGKNLFLEKPVALAVDYGASLLLSSVGIDAGLLASLSFERGELYSAVRGFGTAPWAGFGPSLSAAFTLGAHTPVSERSNVFFELTLTAAPYNSNGPEEGVQPFGFSLVPAIGLIF